MGGHSGFWNGANSMDVNLMERLEMGVDLSCLFCLALGDPGKWTDLRPGFSCVRFISVWKRTGLLAGYS